jgi:hypothetical protein
MRQRKTPKFGDLCEHVVRVGHARTRNVGTNYVGFCEWCEPEDPTVGVRVLVSKERLEQKWPTEKDGPEGAAFRKFAARLADAVQRALADGYELVEGGFASVRDKQVCPLGCLPDSRERGRGSPFYDVKGLTSNDSGFFAGGFDGLSPSDLNMRNPYYRLGRAYRARFVTKGNQENV